MSKKVVLTVDDAAELLSLHPATVHNKARLGEIPGRKIGREWRFSLFQLLRWIEGRDVEDRASTLREREGEKD